MTDCHSDYNYVRSGDNCIPAGLERIPNNMCTSGRSDEMYTGSSGYRLIAGNMCDADRGVKKDEPVRKPCSQGRCFWWIDRVYGADTLVAEPQEGAISNQIVSHSAGDMLVPC